MLEKLPPVAAEAIHPLLLELRELGIAPDSSVLSGLDVGADARERESLDGGPLPQQPGKNWPDLASAREPLSQLPLGMQAIVLAAADVAWRNGYLYALHVDLRDQLLSHPFMQSAPVALRQSVLSRFLGQFLLKTGS